MKESTKRIYEEVKAVHGLINHKAQKAIQKYNLQMWRDNYKNFDARLWILTTIPDMTKTGKYYIDCEREYLSKRNAEIEYWFETHENPLI